MTGKTLLRTPVLISLGGESKCFPSKSILKKYTQKAKITHPGKGERNYLYSYGT